MYNLITSYSEFILNESLSVPFNSKTITSEHKGKKFSYKQYNFSVDDVDLVCRITSNPWSKNYYDVGFVVNGGSTSDRVGKNLDFMNSVLKTVADCVIDFINETDIIKVIAFEGDRIREKAYVRFFKNHPYFSKFEIDDTHTKSGFIEIHINKINQ